MFANLKKKLNVDGSLSDSQPSSPATTPRRSTAQRQEDTESPARASAEPVSNHGDTATAAGSPAGATAASSTVAHVEQSTAEPDNHEMLLSASENRKQAEQLDRVREKEQQLGNSDAGEALPSSAAVQVHAAASRPGDRERLLELLNKKSDQLRSLEYRLQEQAATIEVKEAAIVGLQAELREQRAGVADVVRRLREEHEDQCRKQRADFEAAARQAEVAYRQQLALADRQCAETVVATEEKCHAIAADKLSKMSNVLTRCQEELLRRDQELQELRAQMSEVAVTTSAHTGELATRDEVVAQLQAEKQSLLDTSETVASELCAAREKLRALQLQANSLESELVKKNEQICALEKLTTELQAVRNRLERELRSAQDGSSQIGGSKDADAEQALKMKMSDMEGIIREAEKRERTLNNLLQEKDLALESLDRKLATAKTEWAEHESKMSADWQARWVQMVDEQRASKKAFEQERAVLLAKIAGLEASHDESLERQIEGERRLSESEQELATMRRALAERDEAIQRLQGGAEAAVGMQARLAAEVNRLQNEIHAKEKELTALSASCREKQQAVEKLEQEHAGCAAQNAELTRRLAAWAEQNAGDAARRQADHAAQLDERDCELRRLASEAQRFASAAESAKQAAATAAAELERSSEQLAEAREAARVAGEQRDELEAARRSLHDLEEQLAEKSKALKVQQQRVNELKKTLQRNLKSPGTAASMPSAGDVQQPQQGALLLAAAERWSSPALYAFDGGGARGGGSSKDASGSDSESVNGAPFAAAAAETDAAASDVKPRQDSGSLGNSDFGQVAASRAGSMPALAVRGGGGGEGLSVVSHSPSLAQHDPRTTSPERGRSTDGCDRSRRGRGADERGEFAEVNFEYMRNVVLKFFVCKEAEAVQLVKAISVLLKLSPQEEKLLKDTLEYRMSWFGPRPHIKAK